MIRFLIPAGLYGAALAAPLVAAAKVMRQEWPPSVMVVACILAVVLPIVAFVAARALP